MGNQESHQRAGVGSTPHSPPLHGQERESEEKKMASGAVAQKQTSPSRPPPCEEGTVREKQVAESVAEARRKKTSPPRPPPREEGTVREKQVVESAPLQPSPSHRQEEEKKMEEKRARALAKRKEWVSRFVEEEKECLQDMEYCIQNRLVATRRTLSLSSLDPFFTAYEEIYQIHRDTMPQLESCLNDELQLGEVVVCAGNQLQTPATTLYRLWGQFRQAYCSSYQEFEHLQSRTPHPLTYYLERPEYIIFYYYMRLDDFIRYSREAGVEAGSAVSAHEVVRTIYIQLQDCKYLSLLEGGVREEWGSLVLWDDLLYLREGEGEWEKVTQVFLFTTAMVITKTEWGPDRDVYKYTVTDCVNLQDATITEGRDSEGRKTVVISDQSRGKKFTMRRRIDSLTEPWLLKLQELTVQAQEKADEDKIGIEIANRLAVCEKIMKEKKSVDLTAMQCLLIGFPRSGKSSLMKRLVGKKVKGTTTSTNIAENVVPVEIRRLASATVRASGLTWVELSDLDDEIVSLTEELLDYIQNEIASEGSVPNMPPSFLSLAPAAAVKAEDSPRFNLQLLSKEISQESQFDKPLSTFREALERKKPSSLSEYLRNPWTLYLTDCGGQPEFQELLPALVSGPALYFLVLRLDVPLDEAYNVEYVHSDGRSTVPYKSAFSARQMVTQYLASIASTAQPTRLFRGQRIVTKPKVLFVATHSDKVTEQKVKEVDLELQELVRSTSLFKEGVIEFATRSQLVFTINNLSDNEEDVQKVRAAVERIGSRSNDYKVSTPLSWLAFSILVRGRTGELLDRDYCLELARQCGINTQDELDNALWYLHVIVGVLRYFKLPELENVVIKSPRYLFGKISDLIVETFTFDNAPVGVCEEFTRKGIFTSIEFERITRGDELLPPPKLLRLLEYLNIIASLHKDADSVQYFMPCVLTHAKIVDESFGMPSEVPTLLVTFECGYVPQGLFASLVVYLLSDKMNSKLEWSLEEEYIFWNRISFSVGPYDSVVVAVQPSYLCIGMTTSPHLSRGNWTLPFVCKEIRHSIHQGLTDVARSLNYSSSFKYSWTFICPEEKDGIKHSHPAILKCVSGRPCTLTCPVSRKRWNVSSHHAVWFSEVMLTANDDGTDATLNRSKDLHGDGVHTGASEMEYSQTRDYPQRTRQQQDTQQVLHTEEGYGPVYQPHPYPYLPCHQPHLECLPSHPPPPGYSTTAAPHVANVDPTHSQYGPSVAFTASNAVKVCDVLTMSGFRPSSWQDLASRLHIFDPDSIAEKHSNDLRLQETIRQWLQNDLHASWPKLANEVSMIGDYGTATQQKILNHSRIATHHT